MDNSISGGEICLLDLGAVDLGSPGQGDFNGRPLDGSDICTLLQIGACHLAGNDVIPGKDHDDTLIRQGPTEV